jgi:hypothetical protein
MASRVRALLGLVASFLPSLASAQVFDGGGLTRGINKAKTELAGTGVITENTDLVPVIGRIIKFALPLVGALALLAFVVSGFFLLLGFGTDESITRAKKIMLWSLVGIIVVIISYPVVKFITDFA